MVTMVKQRADKHGSGSPEGRERDRLREEVKLDISWI